MSRHKVDLQAEPLLPAAEVAALFNVHALTVTRSAHAGCRIGSVRTLGGHHGYKQAEVLRLLSTRTQEAAPR